MKAPDSRTPAPDTTASAVIPRQRSTFQVCRISSPYGVYYVRREDLDKRPQNPFVKTCRRDGSYHVERPDAPPRLIHRSNILTLKDITP